MSARTREEIQNQVEARVDAVVLAGAFEQVMLGDLFDLLVDGWYNV